MNVRNVARCWAPVVVGLLLLGVGIACFNYTKPGTLEHHQAWAGEHGRPAPTNTILWSGAVSAVIGSLAIGFGVAGRKGGSVG